MGMQAGAATLENSMEVPQKIKNNGASTPMFTAALPIIAKVWKKPKCPSMDEWIKKMWYIYIQRSITQQSKKNEILPFATMWMELEDIMLSEISQRKTNII